jgi:uncharacterized protein (DUF488 family)
LSRRVFTIGYGAAGQADLIASLQKAGVSLVADVRDVANSRRAGFAKRALSEGLSSAGIGYVHLKALGTPKAGRDAHRSGDLATFRRIYCEVIEQPQAQLALRELADLASAQPVCLFCLEDDWRKCHRAELARILADEFAIKATNLHVHGATE